MKKTTEYRLAMAQMKLYTIIGCNENMAKFFSFKSSFQIRQLSEMNGHIRKKFVIFKNDTKL